MEEYVPCFSCKAKSLNIEGETHRYMLSSPGCWAMYGEVLEREYADFRYARAHHFTVDAYAVQHPGKPDVSQAVNSVAIHLSSLYMLLEKGMSLSEGANFKHRYAQFNKERQFVTPLPHPQNLGDVTVFDVWDSDDPDRHFELSKSWAESAWHAWAEHHDAIKEWTRHFLGREEYNFFG